MSIKAEVAAFLDHFTAEVEFSETAMHFYGPKWEIGLFFGLIPIRGKKKELLRIEYKDIEKVSVKKTSYLIGNKETCSIKVKSNPTKVKNNPAIEVTFIPFESGRAMLFEHVGERFV